jgi:cobalt-precorrin-5B (C1)-methyltransferase
MTSEKSGQKKKLRCGFTTGAAAAAAAKAAVHCLMTERKPDRVSVRLLTGRWIEIAVKQCNSIGRHSVRCTVVKDAGDDPDVTHGAEIGACVTRLGERSGAERVTITGGEGVGRVTKPGLELPPGAAAINPGPVRMIREAVLDAAGRNFAGRLQVEVFVPQGRQLAEKTLNARLGIVGGISILGTTGVVRPMSHEAYAATIHSAMSVAHAAGCHRLVLTTGRRSERHAQKRWADLPEEAFIQIGDYFGDALKRAADFGFRQLILAVFFGKALKMAQGAEHTHAARARLSLPTLARWCLAETGDRDLARRLSAANTAREAFGMLQQTAPGVLALVARKVVQAASLHTGRGTANRCVLFDYQGQVSHDTESGD